MTIRYRVLSLTSSGGDVVTLPASGVTCIVGGNNVGKSQLLTEIARAAYEPEASQAPITIARVDVERPSGTLEETESWLRECMVGFDNRPGEPKTFAMRLGSTPQTPQELMNWFESLHQGPAYLGNAASFFVHHATAGTLANYATGHLSGDQYSQNAPLSKLFHDGDLEAALDDATQETFGQNVVLDRVDVQIALRVGSVDVDIPPINRPTKEYANAVARLPRLDAQGDGIRSFMGLAVQLIAERPNVFLVDEPEAFLHPGQSRAVGRWLGRQAIERDVQLIVATHDRDMVLGLLQSGPDVDINVIRVSRVGDETHFAQLDSDQVRAVWDSPVLRYSNVLQGLFHQKVVVCESDGDCRFFSAALDQLSIARGNRAIADDVLFVPAGSKNRVGHIANSLAQLRVHAEAIVDFDALRNKADIKDIVIGVGADWDQSFESLYTAFVRVPNAKSLWDILKKSGLSAVPAGETYRAAEVMIEKLRDVGVHVIHVGEMEDFEKSISSHGAGWVSEALERGVHTSQLVSDFVAPILLIG